MTNNNELFARVLHHRIDSLAPGDPIATPISLASTFVLPGIPTAHHQYGRWTNPVWDELEAALELLEQARVVTLPSGMAAIASVMMTQLHGGDRLLLPNDGYYTTRILAEKYLVPNGVEVSLCATRDYATVDLTGFSLVWIETPSNPGLDICDLREVSARAHAAGALVVADNTTLTPLGQRPLDLGADVVISADTKALSGHSDVVFGHVASRNDEIITAVSDWRKFVGAIPGPFESWLLHRSLESFEVRFERMCTSAGTIAELLEQHPAILQVRYPGLTSHPDHEIALRQVTQFGSVIGVTFADAESAERFITDTEFIVASTSFGGTHTSAERRARWGDAVPEGYVRLSIGCEPTEALWNAMQTVLDTL
ncbi:MAG: cystathionine gamma-lyase [Thermomicrobiales bacterium]|nr:cystathionine gamma-lyase [Thermomicrobiales bacterium]MCO5225288.1 cystathionine gamma-lyase [Thermomicrobiales bacterium]